MAHVETKLERYLIQCHHETKILFQSQINVNKFSKDIVFSFCLFACFSAIDKRKVRGKECVLVHRSV